MPLYDGFDDGQTQTGPLYLFHIIRLATEELVKDIGLIPWGYTQAGILDLEQNLISFDEPLHGNLSPYGRVLGRIGKQVLQDLPQTSGIRPDQ